jgi:hypothetical protein
VADHAWIDARSAATARGTGRARRHRRPGRLGGGYLAGLFLLVATTVLVLFGPPAGPPVRPARRLSAGGVLLAMLAAIGSTWRHDARIEWSSRSRSNADQLQMSYGRGIWCARVGVAVLAGAATWPGGTSAGGAAGRRDADGERRRARRAVWSWRRPRDRRRTIRRPDEPVRPDRVGHQTVYLVE